MLSVKDNEMLTQIGPGTPMGGLFRRFWLPALLSSELPEPDGEPVRLKLLGEELITYRDTDGRVGCIDAYCPHRGAPIQGLYLATVTVSYTHLTLPTILLV